MNKLQKIFSLTSWSLWLLRDLVALFLYATIDYCGKEEKVLYRSTIFSQYFLPVVRCSCLGGARLSLRDKQLFEISVVEITRVNYIRYPWNASIMKHNLFEALKEEKMENKQTNKQKKKKQKKNATYKTIDGHRRASLPRHQNITAKRIQSQTPRRNKAKVLGRAVLCDCGISWISSLIFFDGGNLKPEYNITKTRFFKCVEKFTSRNWKFSDIKTPIFFIFLLKTKIVGTR